MNIKKITLFFNGQRGLSVFNFLAKKKNLQIENVILAKKNLDIKVIKELKKKKINFKIIEKKKLNFSSKIFKKEIDLFLLCGFPYILKKKFFDKPKFGTLNLHAGPLPYYKGGSPLNWQIINGEKKIGISVIKINQNIDDGDLLSQKFFTLKKNYDIKKVHSITNNIFPKILYESIIKIIKEKKPFIKKNKKKSKYFNQRKEKDGLIDWDRLNQVKVYNLVRAITKPYPGAFTYNSKRDKIIIYKCSLSKKKLSGLANGQVFKDKNKYLIKTMQGAILLKTFTHKLKNLEILK